MPAGVRRKGRELALKALYQMEMTGEQSAAALDFFLQHFEGNAKAREFARRLVDGVIAKRQEIDRALAQSAEHWKLTRMAKVDLTILRIAAFEIIFCADIPMNVSLDEAIEIGKRYGSVESSTFINGVLDQVAAASGAK